MAKFDKYPSRSFLEKVKTNSQISTVNIYIMIIINQQRSYINTARCTHSTLQTYVSYNLSFVKFHQKC